MFNPDPSHLTVRSIFFYFVKDLLYTAGAFIWRFKFKAFSIWLVGRKYFKPFHWTIRSIDFSRKYDNSSAVSVVDSFPEPLLYTYEALLWFYPDSDSNYARAGTILSGTALNEGMLNRATQFITYKAKVVSATSSFAIIIEQIRDNAMIAPVALAKQSNTTECKYYITSGDKNYLEDLYSHSPLWYMTMHSFGERLVNPISNGNFADPLNIITTISYLVQDYKKFEFILRDAGEIVSYLGEHPECVVTVGSEQQQQKTIGFNPLPAHFENAVTVENVMHVAGDSHSKDHDNDVVDEL